MTTVNNTNSLPASLQVANPLPVQQPVQTETKKTFSPDRDFFKISLDWPVGSLSSRASLLTTREYKDVFSLRNEPFSTIVEKYSLNKILSVLPRETLRQKFEAEFGQLSNAELLEKFGWSQLGELNMHGLLPAGKMEQIKEGVKFSEIYPLHEIPFLCDVFSHFVLKEKFDQEFALTSDADLLKTFGMVNLEKLNEWQVISDERMEKIDAVQKELVRSDSGTFSELVKKYGLAELSISFSPDELREKFNAECGGKTEHEILADIDLEFFRSAMGKEIIGDRFKSLFEQGTVHTEKDNVKRTFKITDTSYSIEEKETLEGVIIYSKTYSGSSNNNGFLSRLFLDNFY